MKFILSIAALLLGCSAFADAPHCSITYKKNPYHPGLYVYETVCFYGQGLTQQMQTAWIGLDNNNTAALLDECETQCVALSKAHPNGF